VQIQFCSRRGMQDWLDRGWELFVATVYSRRLTSEASLGLSSEWSCGCNLSWLWWYSERFVVITKQLQAAKCSLSSQLFGHIFTILRFSYCCTQYKQTFFLLVCSSQGPLRIFCLISISDQITKQLSDHSSNSSRIRTLFCHLENHWTSPRVSQSDSYGIIIQTSLCWTNGNKRRISYFFAIV
jgi:hypothetical protein